MSELQGISTFHMVNSITETQHNRGTFNKIKELFGKVYYKFLAVGGGCYVRHRRLYLSPQYDTAEPVIQVGDDSVKT